MIVSPSNAHPVNVALEPNVSVLYEAVVLTMLRYAGGDDKSWIEPLMVKLTLGWAPSTGTPPRDCKKKWYTGSATERIAVPVLEGAEDVVDLVVVEVLEVREELVLVLVLWEKT